VANSIQVCFGLLIASYLAFLLITPGPGLVWLMTLNMIVSCLGFFALRGIYFALLEESGTPRELTGTAVGVISFVGFTPEIFMGPMTGWLIREARNDGNVLVGYQQVFWILTFLSACGMLAAFALRWSKSEDEPART
jgi:glycerol uptake facilitator-like aquaporin